MAAVCGVADFSSSTKLLSGKKHQKNLIKVVSYNNQGFIAPRESVKLLDWAIGTFGRDLKSHDNMYLATHVWAK